MRCAQQRKISSRRVGQTNGPADAGGLEARGAVERENRRVGVQAVAEHVRQIVIAIVIDDSSGKSGFGVEMGHSGRTVKNIVLYLYVAAVVKNSQVDSGIVRKCIMKKLEPGSSWRIVEDAVSGIVMDQRGGQMQFGACRVRLLQADSVGVVRDVHPVQADRPDIACELHPVSYRAGYARRVHLNAVMLPAPLSVFTRMP